MQKGQKPKMMNSILGCKTLNTKSFRSKSHDYPEEIIAIKSNLYDEAFNQWLEVGDYASRPPGELHGPFKTDAGSVILEKSHSNQSLKK
ncbi:MAG: hypothetical protein GXP08_09950 [Gammaproteobacteria bacterium]|nr:hypothetical protein [Gammaproteobacteria bacterium]